MDGSPPRTEDANINCKDSQLCSEPLHSCVVNPTTPITITMISMLATGCFVVNNAGFGDFCDPLNPVHNYLSEEELAECFEGSTDNEGPFACVDKRGYDLCIQIDAQEDTVDQINEWYDFYGKIKYGGCDIAHKYPGNMSFLSQGMDFFICNREGEDTAYKNIPGSIALPSRTKLPGEGMHSLGSEEQLPTGWTSSDMTSLDPVMYQEWIICGSKGFTCRADDFWCSCVCDSDEECNTTQGPVEEWVCEYGLCLHPWDDPFADP